MIPLSTTSLVLIPSGNRLEISENYHEAFEEGYHITTDDIQDHLSVKPRWITYTFTDKVKYIKINTTARQALLAYPDRKWEHLYSKKKLFNKKAYLFFVIENTRLQKKGRLQAVNQIPKKLLSHSDICREYNIPPRNLYRLMDRFDFDKYIVFNMPRYDSQQVAAIFQEWNELQHKIRMGE
ncbi:hypothetical protein MFLO_13695 [Listeria floridensis FSL S10-1187]|uniref:Uncharacterized protein n=1 Tax=Listeria floridensis FSL S10-1187 TaxID=1265817 RepID=A0ABN0RC71_9LIST|nr:hypothetical protein [Listeria floridensis]EUJ26929.1 hypothetical protein MFLO_13695 [Listeria floridensis FSL S10-1187]